MAVKQRRKRAGRLVTVAPCRIRPAQAGDIAALVALERITFADAWSAGDFADGRAAGWPMLIAETDAGVVGYIVGRELLDEAEILNLSVAEGVRRRGIARALVRELLARFAAQGARSVFLEVRESNTAARALYDAFGFRAVGRRPRYYHQPVEDAVVLRAVISADRVTA